jgi:hypothetical protein
MEKSEFKALKANSKFNSHELQYLKFCCEESMK